MPGELTAAATQSDQVIGYLSLLRAFVAELEPAATRRATLHGLIAPDRSPAEFARLMDEAERRERECVAGT